MTLGSGSQSESALLAYNKRKAQLERWRGSDTEKESIEIRSRPKRVKFADKCIFQAACASNDKGQVARMIKEGYDINAVDEDGITALHQACIEDNFDMVEFLLENGADVNISDNEGWTPLHAVATCCYVSIAKLLMEHGANVVALNNDCSIPLDICKSDEIRELFIQEINGKGIDLKDARRGEEVKMMDDAKRWLANGTVDENPHPVTGATAMHVAACKGYIKVLDLLIKAGANMNSQDFDGWTPLHAAAHWGQKEACEVLLEHMCDMGLRNNCDQTALDIADSSVVPLLEEWKKRHDVNKNIDTHNVGKQNLNNLNNNNNNAVTVPPKKKPAPRPTPDDDVTIVTSQLSQDKSPSNISNSISDEPLDQDEEMEEEQEQVVDVVDVDEAEDTVSELPSTSTADCMTPEPISFGHSTTPTLPTGGGVVVGSPTTSSLPPVVVTTSSASASTNQPFSSTTSISSSSDETSGHIAESKRGVSGSLPPPPPPTSTVPSVESFTKLVAESQPAVDTEPTAHSWRRGGSLRTRTGGASSTTSASSSSATSPTASPAGAGVTAGEESTASKGNNERLNVRRTRSDAMAGDSSLRRAYSFESDAKFYSRLRDARNRIKAMEEASAAFSNAIDESIASIWSPTPSTPAGSVKSSSSAAPTTTTTTTSSTRLSPCPEPSPPSIAMSGISTSRTVRSGTSDRVSSSSSSPPLTNPTSHATTPAVTTSNSLNKNNVNTSTEPNSSIISSVSPHPESPITTHGSEQEEDDIKSVVVLRRNKEIETNRSLRPNTLGSPNPSSRPSSSSTAIVTTPTNTTSNIPPNYSETKQTRSGVDVIGTNGGQPTSSLLFTNSSSNLSLHQAANSNSSKQSGAVTKFKNFFKSFVPPTRDEESETQRKAHAKRVRETRRSTQGVTLEELKSAEQYVKNSQSGVSNASGSGTTNSVPVSSSSSRKEQEELGVERRPSWRLRVDEQDRSKFSLEDTRGTTSATGSPSVSGPVPTSRSAAGYHEIPYGLAQRNPALRSKLGKGIVVDPTQLQSVTSAPQGKPPLPPGEESGTSAAGPQQQDEDRDVKNSGGAQGAILRKKKTKRRSTGVVQFNTDGTYPERQDSVPSDSEIGREASDVEQGPESSRSENGVTQRINYKKLYEEVLKENQLLKSKLSRAEEDIAELKLKLDKLSMTPRITSDESEKLEKRALERKLSEMEEELKEIRHLRSENQKLRDENGALIRVISKLSK